MSEFKRILGFAVGVFPESPVHINKTTRFTPAVQIRVYEILSRIR